MTKLIWQVFAPTGTTHVPPPLTDVMCVLDSSPASKNNKWLEPVDGIKTEQLALQLMEPDVIKFVIEYWCVGGVNEPTVLLNAMAKNSGLDTLLNVMLGAAPLVMFTPSVPPFESVM